MKPSTGMALAVWLVGFAVLPSLSAPLPSREELVVEQPFNAAATRAGFAPIATSAPAAEDTTSDRHDVVYELSPRAKLKNNSLAHARDVWNASEPTAIASFVHD
ncbi:hypothetical protein K525DRAFT_279335 [Schizophyllum commune Loenen D]|nr:hypothetical protein K525DRAFT_279335 [Schizophyllum commune Loenen D]